MKKKNTNMDTVMTLQLITVLMDIMLTHTLLRPPTSHTLPQLQQSTMAP